MNNAQTRLGQILQTQGLTQRDLSEKTGLTESQISYLISGKRSGKIDTWFKIAKVLHVSIDDLVYYGGDE